MGTTPATKQDLELLKRDMQSGFAVAEQKLNSLELRMTLKLGSMLFIGFGLLIAALRLWI